MIRDDYAGRPVQASNERGVPVGPGRGGPLTGGTAGTHDRGIIRALRSMGVVTPDLLHEWAPCVRSNQPQSMETDVAWLAGRQRFH